MGHQKQNDEPADMDEWISPDDSAEGGIRAIESCIEFLVQDDRHPESEELYDMVYRITPDLINRLCATQRPDLATQVNEAYERFRQLYDTRDKESVTGKLE